MHLPLKFSDVTIMRIANYLVILENVKSYTYGTKPKDSLQNSSNNGEYKFTKHIHKLWGTFPRFSCPPPLQQTFMKMISSPELIIRPESITS